MKHKLSLAAASFFVAALIIGFITYQDTENEGEIVKAFRDPDRVDKRWLYVVGFGTASICLALWGQDRKR